MGRGKGGREGREGEGRLASHTIFMVSLFNANRLCKSMDVSIIRQVKRTQQNKYHHHNLNLI